jgi:hypothetical protein
MRRPTWLDQIVYSFQHRWETNPQFRAMASGLVGLMVILIMCSCVGVLNSTADSALAAIGLGGTGNAGVQGTPNTGTNQANGYQPIPTPTVIYPTGVVPPQVTVPQSQTPPPGPTATSTPAASDTPTPGGGGGGGGGSCTGNGGGGTSWSFSNVCPPIHGQSVTFTLSAPRYGGQQVQLHVTCGSTLIGYASPFALPGSGIWSQTVTLAASDSGQCSGFYQISGGPTATINGPAIQ